MNKLAIVIPAYKSKYFKHTLDSISKQTCKDFTLYIGDDACGTDIATIVNQYTGKINIKYHYFENNLGGTNLVAQWERCIDLIDDEGWIWLFSDDDIMEENCVEEFYKQITIRKFDIYHFNTLTIDCNNRVLLINPLYPEVVTTDSFCKSVMCNRMKCYVVEWIFSREKFLEQGRFQNFDLAWWSDVATWMKISNEKGIFTVNDTFVYWRASELNITCDFSRQKVMRKVSADIQFLQWKNDFLRKKRQYLDYYILFCFYFFYSNIVNLAQEHSDFKNFCNKNILGRLFLVSLIFIFPIIARLKKLRLKLKNR